MRTLPGPSRPRPLRTMGPEASVYTPQRGWPRPVCRASDRAVKLASGTQLWGAVHQEQKMKTDPLVPKGLSKRSTKPAPDSHASPTPGTGAPSREPAGALKNTQSTRAEGWGGGGCSRHTWSITGDIPGSKTLPRPRFGAPAVKHPCSSAAACSTEGLYMSP